MNFKICERKTLCIDLRKSSQEELTLVINTLISTCELLQSAGHNPLIKVIEETEPTPSNKKAC